MTPTIDAPSPFIPGTTIRYAWDSTSLKALKFCPRYYQYTMIEGYRPRSSGIHLLFGQLYHSAIESWHRGLHEGREPEALLRDIVRQALIGSVGMGEVKGKSRENLIRSIVWYTERWKDDPLETVILPSGTPALEMSFQWQSDVPIESIDGDWAAGAESDEYGPVPLYYLFCGHFDSIVRWQNSAYIKDLKTTGSTLGQYYFDQFTPDTQMSFYPFMSHRLYGVPVRGVLIDAVQVAVTFSDYGRQPAYRTPAMLEEWWNETQWWLRQQVTFSKQDFWPMNDTACRTCAFRPICRKDPSVRSNFLNGPDFVKEPPWNPLARRTPGEAIDLSDA